MEAQATHYMATELSTLQKQYQLAIKLMKELQELWKMYRFDGVISKKKYSIVRLYDSHQRSQKKMKLIDITNCPSEYVRSLSHVLKGVHEIYRKRPMQLQQIKELRYKNGSSYLIIESKYYNCLTLAQTMLEQKSIHFNRDQSGHMKKKVFQLLDCFLESLEINTFVPTAHNIYVEAHRLTFNLTSLCGFDLIFFERTISKSEFKQIYNCLDPTMFGRKPEERLNHKFKIHGFAALFLALILERPVHLLKESELEEAVSFERARELVASMPERYQKYLNNSNVKVTLQKNSSYFNVNLSVFFNKVLANKLIHKHGAEQGAVFELMSWSQLYFLLKTQPPNSEDYAASKLLIDQIAKKLWRSLDGNQQTKYKNHQIAEIYYNKMLKKDFINKNHKQLLLSYLMGLKMAEIQHYSLYSELAQKKEKYDKISNKLVYQLLNIWNNIALKNNRQSQSILISFEFDGENHFMEQILLQIQICSLNRSEQSKAETIDSLTQEEGNVQEERQVQESIKCNEISQSQAQPQSKKQQIPGQVDEILKDIKEVMDHKLTYKFQNQGKHFTVQHQILKGLNSFLRSLR